MYSVITEFLIHIFLGWGAVHSIINTFLVYLVLLIGGPQLGTVISVFVLNFVSVSMNSTLTCVYSCFILSD
jgi:hypothetical protein